MCPYVEASDRRCGNHLTLDNLRHALAHCASEYQQCPVYREIQQDAQRNNRGYRRRLPVAG